MPLTAAELPGLPPDLAGPVAVALTKAVTAVPSPGTLPGGCRYEPKSDGFRLVIVRDSTATRVWSRQGRDLTARFPDIVAAARSQLPPGTVVDGEVVIWHGRRLTSRSCSSGLEPLVWRWVSTEGAGVLNQVLVPKPPGPSQKDATTCLVLGGYSQGAWVIHDLFYGNARYGTPKHEEWLSRMSAVVLLGDPTFQPGDVTDGGWPGPGVLRSGVEDPTDRASCRALAAPRRADKHPARRPRTVPGD